MFTSVDKALAAVLTGGLGLADLLFGVNFGLTDGTIASIAAVLGPILVWAVPNKKPN